MTDHRCPKCEEVLELCEDNFHRNKNNPSGFENQCKTCKNEYYADYRTFQETGVRPRLVNTDDFSKKALLEEIKRIDQPIISIYKPTERP